MNPHSMFVPSFRMGNFLNSQTNLDIMTYLAKGLSFRQIADEIKKKHSFVQTRSDFLKKHSLMAFGRWNIDVQALGMIKTAEFYDYKEEILSEIFGDQSKNLYLSYFSHVMMGEMKYFAIYTYPEEVKDREGFEISSWYYIFPHFSLPFFKDGSFEEELEEYFENENNENPFPPRGERIKNPDLIDIYLCRYIQQELGDVNLREYTERMQEEFNNDEVHYSTVRTRFQRLRDKNIIYPVNPLDFGVLSYTHIFFITNYDEIFRFLKVLGKLNILAAISFMRDGKNMVLVQCPYDTGNAIINFLSSLDRRCLVFITTRVETNRGLPYKYYLRRNRWEI